MVAFWSRQPRRQPKKHHDIAVLQKQLDVTHSDCEFYKTQLSLARHEAARVQRNNLRFQAEKSVLVRQLSTMEEEFRHARNIPLQAEELLEEHRGECIELRTKVNDLNSHNASLAEEIGRLRGQLLWERRERERLGRFQSETVPAILTSFIGSS